MWKKFWHKNVQKEFQKNSEAKKSKKKFLELQKNLKNNSPKAIIDLMRKLNKSRHHPQR